MHVKIRHGLDIPLAGAPRQEIAPGRPIHTVGILGRDVPTPHPELLVAPGDTVRLGQAVCRDPHHPAIVVLSPAAGRVRAIHRGLRRRLESVEIELEGDEAVSFDVLSGTQLDRLSRGEAVERLLGSGVWTTLRARPHERVPDPERIPHSLFVTAMDTRPGAPAVGAVLADRHEALVHGLRLLARLAPVRICTHAGARHALPPLPPGVTQATFAGPHPAGLAGTHIHFLEPVGAGREVWHVRAQDVAALGELLATGRPCTQRVVALSGPLVRDPRLVRTRCGASLQELLEEELAGGESSHDEQGEGNARVIAGSVLDGVAARPPAAYLGQRDQQVSVLAEPRGRRLRRRPRYSAVLPRLLRRRRRRPLALTTARNGRRGAIPSVPAYERVLPLDLLPIPLLRALAVEDVDAARALGCLELAEEDLALCTFVCPAKGDYGPLLRRVLDRIRKDG